MDNAQAVMEAAQAQTATNDAVLTDDDIIHACERLVDEGKDPSNRTVRAVLGRGSYGRIGPVLKQWREANADRIEQARVAAMQIGISADVQAAIDNDVRRVVGEKTRELAEQIQRLRDDADVAAEAYAERVAEIEADRKSVV